MREISERDGVGLLIRRIRVARLRNGAGAVGITSLGLSQEIRRLPLLIRLGD